MTSGGALAKDVLSFGPFSLVASERLLTRDGTPVELGARALDILIALASEPNKAVDKRDLLARVWPDVMVEEGSLRFHMTRLRKALGDGVNGARYITTLAGRGYCFVAPVSRSLHEEAVGERKRAPGLPPSLPARAGRMVGRDETVQRIIEELLAHRFVTVVGPGGIGKTTVATAAGRTISAGFDGQVAFVDLGPLSESRLAPSAVASALGFMVSAENPLVGLTTFLRDKRVLLILDSCEHVIEVLAELAETIFNEAPSVHILATSRESLRVEGEHVHRLFPLRYPPPDESLSASGALDFPAVQLFIDRVTATSDGFALTDADAPVVAEICRRLDGIPLALELAAVRVDMFGVQGLAARLGDRLMLNARGRRTAMPRHQTLRATLDWSYDRLPRAEQLLLNRLSIFSGAFTFDAACAVCPGGELSDIYTPDGIADLVAKSLVARNPGKEPTYRLLDTTRNYANEKLEQTGEHQAIAERHARYICGLFELAAGQWEEQPSAEWLANYRLQIDNLRAALRWAFSDIGDPALGVALTIAAVPLWSQLSLVDESLEWVERALSASVGLPDENRRREMELHAALGGLEMYATSRVKQSNSAWETALAIASELDETDYQLRALRALWAEAINGGRFQQALRLAQRFQEVSSRAGEADDQIISDRLIGTALHFLGEQEPAHAATERMLDRYVGFDSRSHIVRYQFNQRVAARIIRGRILWIRGQTESALRDIEENVAEALTLNHTFSLCNVLTQAACPVALLAGELDTAQRYVDLLHEHTEARALDIWYMYAVCFDAALEIERGGVELGLARLQPAMEKIHRSGFEHYRTSFLMMRASSYLLLDRGADASADIEEAMEICRRTGERWCLPELHRMRGEIVLNQHGRGGIDAAAEAFNQALLLAREQQALAWELRAATSLALCVSGDGRVDGARIVLSQVYAQFTEGFHRPELIAAAKLLERLG